MIDKSIIIKAANYYINNDVTLQEAANYVGIKSKKTLNNYFIKLGESSLDEDKTLYMQIENKKRKNEIQGKKKGGQVGVKTSTWTKDDVLNLYKYMVSKSATYRQIESDLGIPHSTAYEMLHSDFLTDEQREKINEIAQINGHFGNYKDDDLNTTWSI